MSLDSLFVKEAYNSSENIEALRDIFLNHIQEATSLYDIINRYQIQNPQTFSMGYLYSLVKEILVKAFNDKQTNILLPYLSFLSV